MIKVKEVGAVIRNLPAYEGFVTRGEFEALRARVTELEKRNVTPVTHGASIGVTLNGKSNAERQKAYRERRKAGG